MRKSVQGGTCNGKRRFVWARQSRYHPRTGRPVSLFKQMHGGQKLSLLQPQNSAESGPSLSAVQQSTRKYRHPVALPSVCGKKIHFISLLGDAVGLKFFITIRSKRITAFFWSFIIIRQYRLLHSVFSLRDNVLRVSRKKVLLEYLLWCEEPDRTGHIGVGAQSTLRGHKIFARKICIKNQQNARILHDSCPKNYQNTRIFTIFAGKKITKFPNFTWFLPEKPEFYIIIDRKIFFSEF